MQGVGNTLSEATGMGEDVKNSGKGNWEKGNLYSHYGNQWGSFSRTREYRYSAVLIDQFLSHPSLESLPPKVGRNNPQKSNAESRKPWNICS